ncbi:nickel pincer cofactor biosynthesis protein LarC [Campylobacter mucosalis]|uniref:nickel pincer cofactor biosynthesis protein LarC n=1 Tax=Campylobacter mucosalis TaxID=202 RepID=UPI001470528D|nr:nickel pincer cofactor biosynthesis protein LarC [Campylobacter mucosalis]
MIIYYDASAGISGDMNIAALLELGVNFDELKDELLKLNLADEYELELKKVVKNGISASKFDVKLKTHTHERSFKQIKELIQSSNLSQNVKDRAISIFTTIAVAEAKIHNKQIDDIHFHEIGATDSIIDIVGACICYEILGIDEFVSSSIELGGGIVKCEHGELSVPVPAVCEILSGKNVSINRANYEMTTPTGAGILATLCKDSAQRQNFNIKKIGYGAGSKDNENFANVLKIMLCEKSTQNTTNVMIETNIDDMSAESLAFACEVLLKTGANDVFCTPIIMKKGRAGVKLSVLAKSNDAQKIKELIFTHTSAIGLREYEVSKCELPRKIKSVDTKFGEVRVKISDFNGKQKAKAEFEDCKTLAIKHNISINEVAKEALSEKN